MDPSTKYGRQAAISVERLSKSLGGQRIIADVNFEIDAGEVMVALGPSGSGKSTLLRVIAGLERPDAGTLSIAGLDVTGRPPQERGVGFVFQHYAAFKHMTVYDNVAFGLSIRKRPKAEIRERVAQLLELVQLERLAKRY